MNIVKSIPKRYIFFASTAAYSSLMAYFVLNETYALGFNLKAAIYFSLAACLVFALSLLIIKTSYLSYLKVVTVPFVYIFAGFLALNFFPNLLTEFKLAFVLFSAFIYYYLTLSINIFLVVQEKGSVIPLVRPAKTAFLLIEVVALFLFFTGIYKIVLLGPLLEVTFVFHSFLVGLVSFLFVEQYWWSQDLENEITSFVGNESLVIGFLCFMFSMSLGFYDGEAFFRSLAVTTCFYVGINFFQSVVTHRFKTNQYLEYLITSLLVGFLFLLG